MKGKIYRFGEFELKPAECELRNGGSSIRLQEKPLLLLLTLLDHPQTLVTRDELRKRMWDSGTYVDYEQGINVAVKKVRDALGDSAESPRLIQTVAKKGYRLLTAVEVAEASEETLPTRSQSADSANATASWAFAPVGWGLAALAAVIVITLGARFLHSRGGEHPSQPIRSLAILPLRNLSPDPGQDYIADGITEELITDLAQSVPLRVISRTSVMRYKQTSMPVTQIARDLGVDAIVEGAVARSGNRITVTIHLIDANEDRHLWANSAQTEELSATAQSLSEQSTQLLELVSTFNLTANGTSGKKLQTANSQSASSVSSSQQPNLASSSRGFRQPARAARSSAAAKGESNARSGAGFQNWQPVLATAAPGGPVPNDSSFEEF